MKSQDSDVRADPARIEEIFHGAAALPERDQAAFVAAACAGDIQLEAAVRALLAADRAAAPAFDGSALDLEARHTALALPSAHPGDFFGPYRIVRRIAAGGMGLVYEAVRDDEEFHKRVAIKFVHHGADDPASIERFRSERQILAQLEHPSIARLLDGGTTADGIPYLVMEYVDGVPIDRFVVEHQLGRDERIALFLRVCDAVQYAHRNLVIHRDLKPANIPVTADGTPKLLDFGIAKLLSPDARPTATTVYALTPEYASPEQVSGQKISTSSDVYSLGVLLFVLLAERMPYRVDLERPADLVRAICESEPTWTPPGLIHGDVRSVIAQALRKQPDRRYSSVEQFATDVRRYVERRPVEARPDALFYRTRKFVVRHALAVAAMSAIVVAIAAGTVSTIVQARRAERRFNDVRQLANTLIFGIHDAVAPLPGSTPVRQMIVKEGLAYLERLSANAATDPKLQLEIALAYTKIGSVQGRPNVANLGDRAGAIASFRMAEALLRPAATVADPPEPVVRAYVEATRYLSETLVQVSGRRAEAVSAAHQAVAVAEAFERRHVTSNDARTMLGGAYFSAALTAEGDRVQEWQRALRVYRALLADRPDDPARQRNVALMEKYLGGAYEATHDYIAALDHHRAALQLDEERARRKPDDRVVLFDLAIDVSNVAYAQLKVGRLNEAVSLYERSLALRQQLSASDPKDVLARSKVAFIHRQLGQVHIQAGDNEAAAAHLRKAIDIYENADIASIDTRRNLADVLSMLAQIDTAPADRCRAAVRAVELYEKLSPAERTETGSEDLLPAARRRAAACAAPSASIAARTVAR